MFRVSVADAALRRGYAFIGLSLCAERVLGSKREDLENIVARNIDIRYLEQRYLALEKEIANALLRSPADDPGVADLMYRKLIIADEIEQHRRAEQRLALVN